jgi:hypothetical protein
MARFSQTFNWLYSRLPFADTARTKLRVWAEAIRLELVALQTQANAVYDALFVTTAAGDDLDKWGEVLGEARSQGQSDAQYRAELLDRLRAVSSLLTISAIADKVDEIAEGWVPPLEVVKVGPGQTPRVDEHYKPHWGGEPRQYGRREDGLGAQDDYSLGESWGLAELDRLTFSVVLSRIPTQEEAGDLVEGVYDVKAAHVRGYLVNELATTPTVYRVRAKAYKGGVAPWLWADEFNYPGGYAIGEEQGYETFGGSIWVALGTEVFGNSSQGTPGVPHVIVPQLGLPDRLVLPERDIYVDTEIKIDEDTTGSGWAGVALRADPAVSGKMYAVAFAGVAPDCTYAVYYYDGSSWTPIISSTAVGKDMAAYQRVQITLEGQLLTLIVAGTVLRARYDVGNALTTPGRWGLVTVGDNVDLYAENFKYW